MTKQEQENTIIYSRSAHKDPDLKNQEDYCYEFATKQGLNVIKTFVDEGASGNDLKRCGLIKLLKFCEKKHNKVKNVVVIRIDRISRNLVDLMYIAKKLKSLNIKILSATESNDDAISHNILGYLATFSNKMISEQTKKGMKCAFLKGKWLWKAPYGYKNDKNIKNIVPDRQKSKIVKEIFEKFVTGEYSQADILAELSKNINFKSRYLNKILCNPLYCGYMYKPEWSSDPVKGSFKPILSTDIFNRVQDLLDNKSFIIEG